MVISLADLYEKEPAALDFVFCIDASANMAPILDKVKQAVISLSREIVEEWKDWSSDYPAQIRYKVITFRDCRFDAEPLVESPFFSIPDHSQAFSDYIHSIEAKGVDYKSSSALDAIALALKSDWAVSGCFRRHDIIVFSNSFTLPICPRSTKAPYPEHMPKNIEQLSSWWHGFDPTLESTFISHSGRMVAFVPASEPWISMGQDWCWFWTVFFPAATEFKDGDIQCALRLLIHDDF